MMVYLAISIFETQVQKTLNSIWIKLCNVGHFVGQLLEQSLINTRFMSVNAARTTIKYILLVLCIYLWWLDKSVVRSFSPQHFEFRSKSRSPEMMLYFARRHCTTVTMPKSFQLSWDTWLCYVQHYARLSEQNFNARNSIFFYRHQPSKLQRICNTPLLRSHFH